ncbi:6-phosphogluconolactonase [Agromyces aerolatus]|uniref:6-phosphogluconolactonase n=1 Tax=Agromyces sp. LY-1074 TaxID=3074080 RepID=UPI00285C7950|nr:MULTISPECIES: 6-phosphogluconolactonase [unclassified Agromyces]MDR5700672.1 6-phosphogluconolactonase [Agromyces sp. LY-1074]MDR5707193.1 6-phosphogluconolactonase [Agromyces sp. LY-1358]
MTNERRVLVHPDKASLAGAVAARFVTKTLDLLDDQEVVHLALTGGSMGSAVLEAVGASPAHTSLDWSRVHVWWGDERWLPDGDAERNDRQSRDALLDRIALPEGHVHAFPASDSGLSLDDAADRYAEELARFGTGDVAHPVFDITFLGVGPDGHIASLFPHRSGIEVTDRTVIAVRESPKPPPERLSLTRPVLNASQRVWFVLAGADKASALGLALAGASRDEVPVAGIKGRKRTVFFVDRDAAAEVPEELIAREY